MSDEHGKVRADVMTSIALGKEKQEDGKSSGGWFARDQMTLQCLRTAFANLRVGLDEKIDGLMLRHDIDDFLTRMAQTINIVITTGDAGKEFFASTLKGTQEADARNHLVLWLGQRPYGRIDHANGRTDKSANGRSNGPPLDDIPAAIQPSILEQIDQYHDAIAAEMVGLLYHKTGSNPYTRTRIEEACRHQAPANGEGTRSAGVKSIANRTDFVRVYEALCQDAVITRRPVYGEAIKHCVESILETENTAASAAKKLYDLIGTQATKNLRHLSQVGMPRAPFANPVIDLAAFPRPQGLRPQALNAWETAVANHLNTVAVAIGDQVRADTTAVVEEFRGTIAEYLAMADATGPSSLITPAVKHELMLLRNAGAAPTRVSVSHLADAGKATGPVCTNLDKVLVAAAKQYGKKTTFHPSSGPHAAPAAAVAVAAAGKAGGGGSGGGGNKKRKPAMHPVQQALAVDASTPAVADGDSDAPKRARNQHQPDHNRGSGRGRGNGRGGGGGRGSAGGDHHHSGGGGRGRGRGGGRGRGWNRTRNGDRTYGGGYGMLCKHCGYTNHTIESCEAFAQCQLCDRRHRGRDYCQQRRQRMAAEGTVRPANDDTGTDAESKMPR
jgi:hypothetical protein